MFSLFSKSRLSLLLTIVSLSTMSSSLTAEEYSDSCGCNSNRFYIGAFGGGIYSNSSRASQLGTAFFVEAQGGPLAVNAKGHLKSQSTGFGGVQIGYEWLQSPFNIGCSGWTLTPAAELEAYFYSHKQKGHLINDADRLPEHDFIDSFNMNSRVCLVNAVFSLNSCCLKNFTPYLGVGIGATRLSLRNAKSTQVSPPEEGVNHFNASRNDSSWTFAAQAKAGLRYNICQWFHVFAEYRYLYVDSSKYVFGSTVFPGHAATSPWNVRLKNVHYNAFTIGVQFDL